MIDISKQKAIASALKAFNAMVQNGSIVLPEGLTPVDPNSLAEQGLWPNFIVCNQKIVPINWDGSVITLRTP